MPVICTRPQRTISLPSTNAERGLQDRSVRLFSQRPSRGLTTHKLNQVPKQTVGIRVGIDERSKVRTVEQMNAHSSSFSNVIFATDFSEGSLIAGKYAALLAQHYHCKLILLHAFSLERPAAEAELLAHKPSLQREQLEAQLSRAIAELHCDERAEPMITEGTPLEAVIRASQQHRPAMVVLGTHGGSTFKRHFIGSVAEAIIRTIDDPVLTVGPHVPAPPPNRLELKRVLYATDFSVAANDAANYAFAVAESFHCAIDVLHVVSPGDTSKPELLTTTHAKLADAAHEHAGPVSEMFVESGEVRDRILEHVRNRSIDLIVLGAHHHSHLARHIRTGPTFRIIADAACPVLTICPSLDGKLTDRAS